MYRKFRISLIGYKKTLKYKLKEYRLSGEINVPIRAVVMVNDISDKIEPVLVLGVDVKEVKFFDCRVS
jgi:hypothetical protein